MRVLITGAGGFVGGHLTHHLNEQPDTEIFGTFFREPTADRAAAVKAAYTLDLTQTDRVKHLIQEIRPEVIYHLAAQAYIPRSFENPWETLENNIRSQLNLIEACLEFNLKPRMLIISSAQIYGHVRPDEQPLDENAPLRPNSPYSVSKIAQDMLAVQYHLSHDLPIMVARPFNHFGPGQSEQFVAPAFAMQIARIEAGQQPPLMSIGNLEAQRDFTDVRDIVRAYTLITEKGKPGDIYNVASGKAHSIQYLLDTLLSNTDVDIQVQVDPTRLRPTDTPIIEGDASRLQQATGWQPTIPFEQTLRDILADSRQRIQNT